MILTHPDEDHAGGLAAVLQNVSTRAVIGPGLSAGQSGHMDGLAEATQAGVPWRRAFAGDSWSVDGVDFRVLHPKRPEPGTPDDTAPGPNTDPNDWSVVLRVDYGRFSALLMGDADAEVEAGLLDEPEVTLLKAGHHGSRTSTSDEFVRAVLPEYALISVGARNRYGHPDPLVLGRLERAGVHILRTDRDGSVGLVARRDGTVRVTRP